MNVVADTYADCAMSHNRPHFQRWLCQWLRNHLPRRFRRMMFIASTLGVLDWVRDPDPTLMKTLNQELVLANDYSALELPMTKYRWIWRRLPPMTTLQTDPPNFRHLAHSLIRVAPAFLLYGSIEEMTVDLQSVYQVVVAVHDNASMI